MGSHFINLYTCDKNLVNSVIGSKDQQYLEKVSADEKEFPFLIKLINRDYTRDEKKESPDAPELIYAFSTICQKESVDRKVFEVYVDDEETPELHEFVWSDWSQPDELELPFSPYGSPGAAYLAPSDLEPHAKALSAVRDEGGYDKGFISDEDLDELVATIEDAVKKGLGMYVFYFE